MDCIQMEMRLTRRQDPLGEMLNICEMTGRGLGPQTLSFLVKKSNSHSIVTQVALQQKTCAWQPTLLNITSHEHT